MIKAFNSLFVTMLGLGKIKFMPGTFGSLATTIILYYLFHSLNISSNIILIALIIIFVFGFTLEMSLFIYVKRNNSAKIPQLIQL